jgi:hypothetical protein
VTRAVLEARQLEDVVHEAAQPLGLRRDVPVVLVALCLRRDHAVAQHLSVHADRGERRLELVGDGRDEVAPLLGVAQHHGHHAVESREPEHGDGEREPGQCIDVARAAEARQRREDEASVQPLEGLGEAVLVDPATGLRVLGRRSRAERDGRVGGEVGGAERPLAEPCAELVDVDEQPLTIGLPLVDDRSIEQEPPF